MKEKQTTRLEFDIERAVARLDLNWTLKRIKKYAIWKDQAIAEGEDPEKMRRDLLKQLHSLSKGKDLPSREPRQTQVSLKQSLDEPAAMAILRLIMYSESPRKGWGNANS